jgi:hypothetical protein
MASAASTTAGKPRVSIIPTAIAIFLLLKTLVEIMKYLYAEKRILYPIILNRKMRV